MLLKIFALPPFGFDSSLSNMCRNYFPAPPVTDG